MAEQRALRCRGKRRHSWYTAREFVAAGGRLKQWRQCRFCRAFKGRYA